MRACGGSAGTQAGRNIAKSTTYSTYSPTSMKAGVNAPLYMSPTLRPTWSAMMMSTSEGGMICASVPEAAMAPAASDRS